MPDNNISDIQFQPKTQGYSYTTIPKQKIKTNIFIALFLGLPVLLLLFFSFLIVLNYFNFISLSTISPVFSKLPTSIVKIDQTKNANEEKPYNIPGTNEYIIDGTLEKYDQNTFDIKSANKTIAIEYNFDSKFYFSKTLINTEDATHSAETIAILDFPSNILDKENLGKKVSIQYSKEKNKNILESLTIEK